MTVVGDWYAEVNDVPLDTFGWRVTATGYDMLLDSPALRGSDIVMPGAVGQRGYQRVVDATFVSIPINIIGEYDQDGVANPVPFEGMAENRDYLRDNLGIAEDGDPDRGSVSMVFHRGSLPDIGAQVIVLGLFGFTVLDRLRGEALVRLDLKILPGELTEGGS